MSSNDINLSSFCMQYSLSFQINRFMAFREEIYNVDVLKLTINFATKFTNRNRLIVNLG